MIRRFVLSGLLLFAPFAAVAETPPICDRPDLGGVACRSGRLCECIYDRGGLMSGIPAGYRWDCGILRPRCGDAAVPPASVQEYRGTPPALPLAVGIDNSDHSVTVGE